MCPYLLIVITVTVYVHTSWFGRIYVLANPGFFLVSLSDKSCTHVFEIVLELPRVVESPAGDGELVEAPGRRHGARLADGPDVGRPRGERVGQLDEGDVVLDARDGQSQVQRVVPCPLEIQPRGVKWSE